MVLNRILLGFTAVVGVVLVCRPATVNGEMSEVEQMCSETVKSGFKAILDIVAKRPQIDPVYFKANDPFTGCYFYGISGIITIGECPSKEIVKCESILHTVTLRIVKARLVCGCVLKSNPASCLQDLIALTKKKNMGMPCNITEEKLKQYKPKSVDPASMMKIEELLRCEECASIVNVKGATGKVPTSLGGLAATVKDNAKELPTTVEGNVTAVWDNVNIELQFMHNLPTDEMKPHGGKLLSQNIDDIAITCLGNQIINGKDPFQAPCLCMKKANFMKIFLLEFMNMLFPCYCDGGASEAKKIAGENLEGTETVAKTMFSQLSCKEFYCP